MNFGSGGDLFEDGIATGEGMDAAYGGETAEASAGHEDVDDGVAAQGAQDGPQVPAVPLESLMLGMSFGLVAGGDEDVAFDAQGVREDEGEDDAYETEAAGDDGDDEDAYDDAFAGDAEQAYASLDDAYGDDPYVAGDVWADAGDEAVTRDLSAAREQSRGRSMTRTVIVSFAGLVGVIVALGVVMLVMRPYMTEPVPEPRPVEANADGQEVRQDEPEARQGTAMLDEIVDTGNGYGVTKLLADDSSESISLKGRIKNLGEELRENVAIGVYLYDRDGSVIGVATGFVDRIEPGEVADFVAKADIATSDVANVALAEVRW